MFTTGMRDIEDNKRNNGTSIQLSRTTFDSKGGEGGTDLPFFLSQCSSQTVSHSFPQFVPALLPLPISVNHVPLTLLSPYFIHTFRRNL